ncbi:MFS transporter [Paenibacillus thalictri]|nr:MFS transporter [Paenibacillus thalictri]
MPESGRMPVIIIAWVTAICILGDSMLYIVLPVYWEQFGLDALWQVGVLLSINRFVRLPLNPLIGPLYRRITKRSGVLIAVALAIVTTWSYGFLHGFWVLAAMRALWGAAWSLLRLGGYLTVLECASERTRGGLLGTYNGLIGVGSLIGMLAGGVLADIVGVRTVCAVLGVLTLAGIPFVLRYIPATVSVSHDSSPAPESEKTFQWRHREALFVLTSGIVISIVYFGMYTSTMSRMVEEHTADALLPGLLIGAATLTGIVQAIRWSWSPFLSPWIGRLSDRMPSRLPLFVGSLLLGGVIFALLPIQLPVWLWLAVLLVAQLSNTAVLTLMDAVASDTASRTSKVAFMTAYTTGTDLGAAIGPFIGYALAAQLGLGSIYWLSAVLLLAVGAAWAAASRKAGRRPAVTGKM